MMEFDILEKNVFFCHPATTLLKKEKVIENKGFTTWVGEERICYTRVKPSVDITLEMALENTQAVIKVTEGESLPMLVDIRNIKSITKEARDHFSMRGRKGHVNAIAILMSSPVSKLIGNFFLGLNKPTVPTRLFTRQDNAISWLKRKIQ